MGVSIRGGIVDADLIKGVYYPSSYVLTLEYEDEKYFAALSPSDEEAKSYMQKVPKSFKAVIETTAKGISKKLIFAGNGQIKGFAGRGKNLFLILATNHGTYSLVFLELSTLKLQQKSIGKDELKDRPCDILFLF